MPFLVSGPVSSICPSAAVQLLRTNHLVASGPNEGPGKPPNIQRILGR